MLESQNWDKVVILGFTCQSRATACPVWATIVCLFCEMVESMGRPLIYRKVWWLLMVRRSEGYCRTVTYKREQFFETVKCTDFWKPLQISCWIFGWIATRRQSKSLDWISIISLDRNCYCQGLVLIFCAYPFICHPRISEWFTIVCCLAVNPWDRGSLFLILPPVLSKCGVSVQRASARQRLCKQGLCFCICVQPTESLRQDVLLLHSMAGMEQGEAGNCALLEAPPILCILHI